MESSVFQACRHQTDGYSRYNFLKGQTTVKRHSCKGCVYVTFRRWLRIAFDPLGTFLVSDSEGPFMFL